MLFLRHPLSAERALQMCLVSEVTDGASPHQRTAALTIALTEVLDCEANSAAALWCTPTMPKGCMPFKSGGGRLSPAAERAAQRYSGD